MLTTASCTAMNVRKVQRKNYIDIILPMVTIFYFTVETPLLDNSAISIAINKSKHE